jgi:GTP-binding protein HflX
MTIYGNIHGLKKSDLKTVERLYRRRIPAENAFTVELYNYMVSVSFEIGRQVGAIVDRAGKILYVIVGDAHSLVIPNLDDFPIGKKTLRGLRLLHTHLRNEPPTDDDLTDLSILRLDAVFVFGVLSNGEPGHLYWAHLLPNVANQRPYEVEGPLDFHHFTNDYASVIEALETEMEFQRSASFSLHDNRERAILVSACNCAPQEQKDSIEELTELALSCNVIVLDSILQRLKEINPRYLMGSGKLKELAISALQKGATLLIFDQDLTPAQTHAISEMVELKVIDRSQLILDIFANRAHSKEGKVQVELAQLRYRLPKLTGKGTAMSRLTGGIGGRGPGEMKLEIDRRRVRDRITLLEKELDNLSRARKQRKAKRADSNVPIISIVGYTNAGKSTLLNNLTNSATFVEDKMFATLDTASRRLRFPKERDVIITDTVGFIRDLPKELFAAFRATLEELEDADLLLHLVDISNPRFQQQIRSVERILEELELANKAKILVFNKIDRLDSEELDGICKRFEGTPICAIDSATFPLLLETIEQKLWSDREDRSCGTRNSQ